MKPQIFISSVSRELRTARQLVANTLHALGYEPVWQDIFETSSEDIRPMLRRQIDSCSAELQIVGHAYGAEPPTPDATFGRCSYTQYEALYAHSRKKPVYYLIAENDLPRDAAAETIDTPRDESDAAKEDAAQRQRLQAEYRQKVLTAEQVYYPIRTPQETELSVRRLRDDLSKLRRGFRNWMVGITAALVLIAGGVAWLNRGQREQVVKIVEVAEAQRKADEQAAVAFVKSDEAAKKTAADIAEIKANQKITADRIRAQRLEESKSILAQDLAEADKEPLYEEQERLQELAKQRHATRCVRDDDLANRFAEVDSRPDTIEVFHEMTRILSEGKENAGEKAIALSDKKGSARLEEVRLRKQVEAARKLAEQERDRAELQPNLKAASLKVAKDPAGARTRFEELLVLEPNWPDVLDAYGWFLFDQSIQSGQHGTLATALTDAQRCFELAERWQGLDPPNPAGQRLLSMAHTNMGDVLFKRDKPGDAEKVLAHFTRSLEMEEQLWAAKPDSAEAARDVSVSLERLGGFLSRRGQPGDAEQALALYERCQEVLEQLLEANPDSEEAARDVSVNLNDLGDFLSRRGRLGDADQALAHYVRSLNVRERLLDANPDSAEAARDVSRSLVRLGDVLSRRGRLGDSEHSLAHYKRSLKMNERLLDANPDSAQAARDVSLSLERVGDFLSLRGQPGDAEQALAHYERSLDMNERLLDANSDSAEAARAVSQSLKGLSDKLFKRDKPGDAEQALAHYERSLKMAEQLLRANPDSAEAGRDMSRSLEGLGDMLSKRDKPGDAEQALTHFERSLKERKRLLTANSDSAEAARDVSLSLERLGDVLSRRGQPGDAEQALDHYEQSHEVREQLLKANPDSAEAARDVSLSLVRLGDVLSKRDKPGDAEQALAHYERCLEMNERLRMANPDSAIYAQDVMLSHNTLAEFSVTRDRFAEAIPHFQRAIAVLEQMLEQKPNVEATQREKAMLEGRVQYCQDAVLATGDWETLMGPHDAERRATLLSMRTTLLAKQGKFDDVAQAGAKLRELAAMATSGSKNDENGVMLYNAACAYALCAGLVVKDKPTPSAAELAEQKPYLELSLACLKESIAAGYANFDHLRQDTDLTVLQGLPEFEALFPKKAETPPTP